MGVNANELIAHIEELNKQVAQLNSERQRQLGLLEATKNQFEACVENYRTIYGVQLTAENLNAEYNKVLNETNQAAAELEKKIQYITSGAYKQEAKKPEPAVQGVTSSNFTAPTGFNGFGGTVNTTPVAQPVNNVPVAQSVNSASVAQSTNSVQPNDPPFDPDPPKPINGGGIPGSAFANMPKSNVQPTQEQQVNTAPVSPIQQTLQNAGVPIFNQNSSQGVPVVQTSAVPIGEDKEEPVAPLNWGTPAQQVGSGEVNNMLTGMFGEKFGG